MGRNRQDDDLQPREGPVKADTLDDREGIDGLLYVTGVSPYRSLDEMTRAEEQKQREDRDAEDRMDRQARARVQQALAAKRLPAEAAAEPDDAGSSDEDVLVAAEEVIPLEELEANPESRHAQDVDIQGREGDAERDWQGQPGAEPDTFRPRLNDGNRRR